MKRILFLLILLAVVISCGSRKSTTTTYKKPTNSTVNSTKKIASKYSGKNSYQVQKIIEDAENYLGSPYKSGGNSSSGFDCSGLVKLVFDENKIKLPRRSADQALQGKKIENWEIKPGDLLFFATSGNGNVSHVGIVREINVQGEITFIHSSTSKGVIISSLNEKYWNNAFLFARRVL